MNSFLPITTTSRCIFYNLIKKMCFSNKFSEKPKSARAISRRRNTVDTRQLMFNLDDEDEDNNEGDNSKPLENDSASEVIELIVCF